MEPETSEVASIVNVGARYGIDGRVWPLMLFAITLISRIPFTSKLLYSQDAVQFALAIEKFDVYLHQPHPPGYFLYVIAGKLLNLFFHDTNSSFLVLSIIASGLTVVAVYHLGRALFDQETGLWAAGFAVTSPLLWYYGELALTYVVAAFLNTVIAVICWDLVKGRSKWLYVSPVILGITGGVRQDVLIFLVPLWLFCILRFNWRKVLIVGFILGLTVVSWFVPMLFMTGGPERYFLAVRELWYFHNRTFAIWNAGVASRGYFLLALIGNTSYGIGMGMIFLLFALYILVRTGDRRRFLRKKFSFFTLWLVPAFLFHIFIFMHPGEPAYSVFFLPGIFVLLWPAIQSILAEISRVAGQRRRATNSVARATALVIVVVNAVFFLFSDSVVSARGIREHDNNLAVILRGLERNFSPTNTIVIDDKSYSLYSYRHIQYYLRRYRVYLTALSQSHGEGWHIVEAQDGLTFFAQRVDISRQVRYIVYVTNPLDRTYVETLEAKGFRRLQLDERNALFYQVRK